MNAERTGRAQRDSVIGTDKAPERYSGQERETIDRIRDYLGDTLFVGWCYGNLIKYMDRAGKKGSFEEDKAKALFYAEMAYHVRQPESQEDPRSGRPGFEPYEQQDSNAGLEAQAFLLGVDADSWVAKISDGFVDGHGASDAD